jgi:hypothetical protein
MVIVTARTGEPRQRLCNAVGGRSAMPASISSKTIVSPPPTAAIAKGEPARTGPVSAAGQAAGPRSA